MAYKLKRDEPLATGIRRIAAEQLDKALAEIESSRDSDDAVHAVRKRCKKLRALLRLARDGLGRAYERENRTLRDVARGLAAFRDGTVVLGTHDALIGRFGEVLDRDALAAVRRRLAGLGPGRDAGADGARLAERLRESYAALAEVRGRVARWNVQGEPGAILRADFKRTYARGRAAFRLAADGGRPEAFHEWRKPVKYHAYHTQLTAPLSTAPTTRRRKQALELSELLGRAHDLAAYEQRLDAIAYGADATAVETLRALAVWRRADLERRAIRLGRRLFAVKPKALAGRLEAPRRAESLRATG